MFTHCEGSSVANKTLLVWLVGSLTNAMSFLSALSLETHQSITVNKARASQSWVRFSTDYVRCFCNLPHCVTTGYMCKSGAGGCFSNLLEHMGHHSKDYKGRHGCLEVTHNQSGSRCSNSEEHDTNKTFSFCCYYDMCNHIDNPQTRNLINKTLIEPFDTSMQQPVNYTSSHVWFRAATIAVPVCGAVILLMLIFLAVKILQNENRHSARHKLRFPSCEQRMYSTSKHDSDIVECNDDKILDKSQHPKFFCLHETKNWPKIQIPLLLHEANEQCGGNTNKSNLVTNLLPRERTANSCADSDEVLVNF